jgi:hypothetical protein
MFVYVNGDSHAAAAEAAVPYGWAEDDPLFYGLGKRPHPENERVSFGCTIANQLNAILQCDAQSGASNTRIIRTTEQFIDNVTRTEDLFIIIQWSTWEREEWVIEDNYYQVGASGLDTIPESHQDKYREFVTGINWRQCQEYWHKRIWEFHSKLLDLKIAHVFFNGNNHFQDLLQQYKWNCNYIGPYDANLTYNAILRENGYKTVNKDSWHFGEDAHCFWAEYMLNYAQSNNLIP